eukprot:gene11468-22915_t
MASHQRRPDIMLAILNEDRDKETAELTAGLKEHGYSLETTKGDAGWDRWHAAVARAYVVWGTAGWAADQDMQLTFKVAINARTAIGAASTVLAVLPKGTLPADAPAPWVGGATETKGAARAAVGGCIGGGAGGVQALVVQLQALGIEPSTYTYTATDNVEHVPVDVASDGSIGISLASEGPVHRIISVNPDL